MSMSSSYLPSSSCPTHRRTALQPPHDNRPVAPAHPLQTPALAPAPNVRPLFQFLAFGLILLLGAVQFFLPATHFRDPSDPLRNWLPLNNSSSSKLIEFGASRNGDGGTGDDDGMVHVVSWIDCLDLRLLAVLANSTLSSSRYPDMVFFHFFVPEGNRDKVSFYKLKVLFPHSNLEIHGQDEVKQVIRTAFLGTQYAETSFEEIVPFIIPTVHQFLCKFIYVPANVIVKGRVEELIGVDLANYAVAAVEDCSKKLNSYVNSDVLDAIQRSASKPWVSEAPYPKDTCMPSLSVLLIDARMLEKDFTEAVIWWSKVLNLRERGSQNGLAVALTLYNRYLQLSSSWLVKDSTSSEINNNMVVLYDGPKYVCTESGSSKDLESIQGNAWAQFLPSSSYQILGS